MSMAISTTIETSFAEAVDKTREALSDQGFGVLTEIDVTSTLKQKLDEDMEDYLILGACNPPLAHQALGVDRQIGLLLPCNVVVRTDTDNPGSVHVEAMDPQIMVQVAEQPDLQPVADDAATRLRAAIAALTDSP
ncbi:DUF302 domain-containing protein [Mycolicibacterium cosmeticum]|jgi:uncharacterized protein (DUF302 family)|uniref:DUF302 domain-containing protein n=1 Tax=Mycolicibacterium cosmeticum TaxID=258533 RepID=W9AXA6_MYCCO|nr:DUF302 domain-containing protein [Mycolicibacterium cosmeticum]TLH81433.1 DUF302 domain-containing protein [Mycolicibacterium cosmeticum]CDO10459.1 hypothetical protein BN977_05292 [Mycolicibacterium cosmeticum]